MKNKRLSTSVPDLENVLPESHVLISAYITRVASDCMLSVLIYMNLVQVTALTAKIMLFLSVSEI